VAEPFPEAHSRDGQGTNWALPRASDVLTGRQCWKDALGLGAVVVTKHDADDDRAVEVVMGGVRQAVEGEAWVRQSGNPSRWRSVWR
jgi:hypothetical protein